MTSNEERRLKILKYVKQRQKANQKTTKAVVVRYMKEKKLSSGETTHNIIKDLKNEGKLNVEVLNSQVHFLTINEDNEFNKIYNFLADIENMMNIVDVPFRKFLLDPLDGSKLDLDVANGYHPIIEPLQGIYLEVIPILFQELLTRSNNNIHLEKDKQIINSKILQLQQKFIVYVGKQAMTTQKLDKFTARLERIDSKVLASSSARVKEINPNLLNELKSIAQEFMRVLEKFKKEFP